MFSTNDSGSGVPRLARMARNLARTFPLSLSPLFVCSSFLDKLLMYYSTLCFSCQQVASAERERERGRHGHCTHTHTHTHRHRMLCTLLSFLSLDATAPNLVRAAKSSVLFCSGRRCWQTEMAAQIKLIGTKLAAASAAGRLFQGLFSSSLSLSLSLSLLLLLGLIKMPTVLYNNVNYYFYVCVCLKDNEKYSSPSPYDYDFVPSWPLSSYLTPFANFYCS